MRSGEYFKEWLAGERVRVRLSTWEALTIYINKHIAPYFEAYDLRDITPALCQRYAQDKLENGRRDGRGGLSAVSVRKHVSVLKQALGEAVCLGYLQSNPAQYVRLPRLQSSGYERTVFLTSEQAQVMLKAFEGDKLYPAVVLALYYGLRRSEVLGLRWQAVDFDRNILTVEHTVVKNLTTEATDRTKTETSRRAFQLLPEVREMLSEGKNKASRGEDYIFSRADGSPMRPDSLTRGFQRVLRKNALPSMRFHDLRHSTASILFDRGWQLEDVKNWLGHSDIETTSNIYLHYSKARKILLARGLEGMLITKKKP